MLEPLLWNRGARLEVVWTHSQLCLAHLSSLINIFSYNSKSLQPLVIQPSHCYHSTWTGSEKQDFSLPADLRCGASGSCPPQRAAVLLAHPGFPWLCPLQTQQSSLWGFPLQLSVLLHLQGQCAMNISSSFSSLFFLHSSLRPIFSFGISNLVFDFGRAHLCQD